jgi:hypothetical protein
MPIAWAHISTTATGSMTAHTVRYPEPPRGSTRRRPPFASGSSGHWCHEPAYPVREGLVVVNY